MRRDIRVTVKVQNANILRRMNAAGIFTVSDLARRLDINQSLLGNIINMKVSGRTKAGEWRKPVMDLAKLFGCLPEDLFSKRQELEELRKNVASRDVSEGEIAQLMQQPITPEQNLLTAEGSKVISDMVDTLENPRESEVIRRRYGLDGEPEMTLQQLAEEYGVSRERVRQLELKAIRHLSHPRRSIELRRVKSDFGLAGDDFSRSYVQFNPHWLSESTDVRDRRELEPCPKHGNARIHRETVDGETVFRCYACSRLLDKSPAYHARMDDLKNFEEHRKTRKAAREAENAEWRARHNAETDADWIAKWGGNRASPDEPVIAPAIQDLERSDVEPCPDHGMVGVTSFDLVEAEGYVQFKLRCAKCKTQLFLTEECLKRTGGENYHHGEQA